MKVVAVGAILCLAGACAGQSSQPEVDLIGPAPSPTAHSGPSLMISAPSVLPSSVTASTSASSDESAPRTASPFVPGHLVVAAATGTRDVDADIIALPTRKIWSDWQQKYVSAFGTPDIRTDPRALEVVTWWQSGPKLGERSRGLIAVFLGHTSSRKRAVFNDLGKLTLGTVMVVTSTDRKTVARLVLIKTVRDIDKDDPDALKKVLSAAPSEADAAAVTCSGGLVTTPSGTVVHEDNTVAFWRIESMQAQ